MTFYEDCDGRIPEIRMRIEDEVADRNCCTNMRKGDYYKLGRDESEEGGRDWIIGEETSIPCGKWRWSVVWYWLKLALIVVVFASLGFVFMKWVGPFLMNKELIPIINWEKSTFSTPVLGILIFSSVAVFPSLLLPSTPSMWIAGMTFGYVYGFLLILSAVAVGVSLPYFIGFLFLGKLQTWLENYPKEAAYLRAAGEGSWFRQFKAVTLIRISPFPYILYNYFAIATNVKFAPYLAGSMVGMVPDVFLSIYTGVFLKTLADASSEQQLLAAPPIIFNVLGFSAAVATAIVITVYAKRKLKPLCDDPLLS